MGKKRYVYVIEIWGRSKWMPCAAASLSAADARRDLNDYWKVNNPADKFKVTRYVREYDE